MSPDRFERANDDGLSAECFGSHSRKSTCVDRRAAMSHPLFLSCRNLSCKELVLNQEVEETRRTTKTT